MNTPQYKPLKRNGTSMYVFPSVAEDKNFENQNENYKMTLSHFVLLNFPREISGDVLDFETSFNQNGTSIAPAKFKDRLVESLRNYVANQSSVIRNSKINANTFYYDTYETSTVDEKIFWKWCKKLGIISYEPADTVNDYFGANPKYNDNGPLGNSDYFREYLWKERSDKSYDVLTSSTITFGSVIGLYKEAIITLTSSSTLKPGDFIFLSDNKTLSNNGNLLVPTILPPPSPDITPAVKLQVSNISTTNTLNDTITILVNASATLADFGNYADITIVNAYERFVQLVGEISGINNVQHPDRAWTEAQAHISYQQGQIPYCLWNTKNDNNYKPGSVFPILPIEIQQEIQGGESPTNPILTNPTEYPGDIWAQFDTPGFTYTSESGNVLKRSGNYYGNNAINNTSPTLLYPDFDGSTIDGITLNLNIEDYAKAVSYTFPIESFNEFTATSFNNIAPKDFEFNAVLWYYTVEDVTGNEIKLSTNIYGLEFLDTPDNDVDTINQNKIPSNKKWVSNGYQDGNAYTFSLDINYAIDSDVEPASFDPDKVYSLFGMELYYEALTRLTYFNDQVTNLIISNNSLSQKVSDLTGLVYTQQSLESIRNRMDNIENLLNVYSTLQIGLSSTIQPILDTSVTPPLIRLNSIDKQYGYVYTYNTRDMFTDFINVNSFTEYSVIEKTIPIISGGKDFLVQVNNNDYNDPSVQYDPGILLPNLSLVLEKDLEFKQKIDIIITTKDESIINGKAIWDKKLDLFINYNDGTSINKILLNTLNLPVVETKQGALRLPEYGQTYNKLPEFQISNIYYSMPNSAERNLVIDIEDDLVYSAYSNSLSNTKKLQQNMRLFIDNLYLSNFPSNPVGSTFKNLSGQYQISIDPQYNIRSIDNVEIVTSGTGYGANKTVICDVSMLPLPLTYTSKVVLQTNASGEVIHLSLFNENGIKTTPLTTDYASPFTPTFSNIINLNTGAVDTLSAGTGLTIKFRTKKSTRINVKFNNYTTDAALNAFLTNYDVALGVTSKPLNTLFNLSGYMKNTPVMSFLKHWKISIIRINDVNNIQSTEINKRYNIKIEKY